MTLTILELLQAHHPQSFEERGVVVPFTTPGLAGGRVRTGNRGRRELVLPNPSGGRGIYVVAWDDRRSICRPTLHDMWLGNQIAALALVSPASIRFLARQAALHGLVGKDAEAAAALASGAEANNIKLSKQYVLREICRYVPSLRVDWPFDCVDTNALRENYDSALLQLASVLGVSVDLVTEAIDDLAHAVSATGVAGTSPLLLTIKSIITLRNETAEWARNNRDNSMVSAAIVACLAEVTISLAEDALAEIQPLLVDPLRLLLASIRAPTMIRRRVDRAEWLLDGWGHICALWRLAKSADARRVRLDEIVYIVPPIPREGEPLKEFLAAADLEDILRYERVDKAIESWRSGMDSFDLIARNEAVRTECLSADYPTAYAA